MHTSFRWSKNLIAAASFFLACAEGLCAQATFTKLGPSISFASDVSADGSVVVGLVGSFPARWTKSGAPLLLGFSKNTNTSGSDDGNTIVGTVSTGGNDRHAYQWTQGGGLMDLGVPSNGQWSSAFAVSGDGGTVVGTAGGGAIGDGYHAVRWTQSTGMVDLDTMGGPNSEARDVSFDGSIVTGGMRFSGGYQAFLWQADTGPQPLGTLGGGQSIGLGMNSSGTVVVGAVYGTSEAFRWTANEGMVGLGALTNSSTQAFDVSDDGSTIIGISGTQGFLWTPATGMQSLLDVLKNQYGLGNALSDWDVLRPQAVSPDGRYIVGTGSQGGWLLDRGVTPPFAPVPEAAMGGVMGAFGLMGLILHRVRSRRDRLKSV
ncbi:MAG: hypothetical protein ABIO94_07115 [Opitutaceae bacterium]